MTLDPELRRFAKLVAAHEARLNKLDKANNTDQFPSSSNENGSIPSYDIDGNLRQIWGLQGDGTFAVTYANGPPPPQPSTPVAGGRELAIVVYWDGTCLDADGATIPPPADLARVEVHTSETSGFEPNSATLGPTLVAEGVVSVPADLNTKYVKLVAVTTSDVAGPPSVEVTTAAFPASNLAITDTLIIAGDGRLIAGDPNGARTGFSAEGIRQFDEEGDVTVQIGSNPAAGNTLTVQGTPSEKRMNLCTNPKLDTHLGGWGGSRGSHSRVNGARVGTDWCLRLIGDGQANPYFGHALEGVASKQLALQYTVNPNVPVTIDVNVDGTDPQGNYMSPVAPSADIALVADTPRVVTRMVTIPNNMVFAQPHIVIFAAAGEFTSSEYLDASLICWEESPVVRDYFDGDTVIVWGEDNLAPNPDFATDATGWVVVSWGTLVRSSEQAHSGGFSGKVTSDGTQSYVETATTHLSIVPHDEVTWELWVYFASDASVLAGLHWFDGNDVFLSADAPATTGLAAGMWHQFGGTLTAPDNARKVALAFRRTDSPSGAADAFYMDDALLRAESSSEITEGQWTGLAGNSQSTLITPPTLIRENISTNPKLENNATGWGHLWADTFARVDGSHMGTNWAARVTGDSGARSYRAVEMPGVLTEPLTDYILSVDLYAPQQETVYLSIDMYSDADLIDNTTYIKSDHGPTITVPANTLVRAEARLTAAASTRKILPFVIIEPGMPNGEHIDATRCLFERTSIQRSYFDGDYENAKWTGTPENSTSVMIEAGTFDNETLASLSDAGSLSVQRLSTVELSVGGHTLDEHLAPFREGTPGWGQVYGDSPHTTTEIGWFEIAFVTKPDRQYIFQTSPIRLRGGDNASLMAHWTTDGSPPLVSSPVLTSAEGEKNNTQSLFAILRSAPNTQIRILLSVQSWTGNEVWLSAAGATGATAYIQDAGPDRKPAHVITGGGGSSAPPQQQYNTQWRATAGKTWNQHGFRKDGECIQGYYPDGWNGDNTSIFFFDWQNIQSTLQGATIDSIDIFVYLHYTYYNAGGTAVFGYGNKTTEGGTYQIDDPGIAYQHIEKGAGRWCELPVWLGEGFRDGWATHINLDSEFLGHDLEYYIRADWDAILSISYTK